MYKSKKSSFSQTAHSQCVGNQSHLVRYYAFSLFRFPSLLRPSESSLPFAPFVLGATIGRQMTATTTMRGATRGMKIAARGGWEKRRRKTDRAREKERKREREREREEEGKRAMGKGGWTKGNEKDRKCVERAEGRGKMNDRKTREYWSRELYSLSTA